MPISTKLFNEQTIRSFGVMTDRTAELQKQVSTGKKDMRPSTDTIVQCSCLPLKSCEALLIAIKPILILVKTD